MNKLTDRQRAVLEFISGSITQRGYPPTLREIGNHLGIRSTNGVNDHLRALERKGFLTREDMKSRTLRLVHDSSNPAQNEVLEEIDIIEIPVLGRVAAGSLTEAIAHAEDSVRVDRMLVGGQTRDLFGLRISGDSMIDAGIHNGDFVFVRKQIEAHKGDIVIAMVGEEATCKYFYPEPNAIRLVPANTTMQPIVISSDDWRSTQILGIVVGVYRRLH